MGSVYKITNMLNGMVYIGATHRDPETTRKHDHLNTQTNGNRKVRKAVAEYGEDVFTFEILHADVPDEYLKALEREEIGKHNCVSPDGYNLTDENGSPCDETRQKLSEANKGKTHSEETRRKISENNRSKDPEVRRKMSENHGSKRPEVRRKHAEAMKGKTHSEETKRKMSENNAMKRPEVRQKMSEALKGRTVSEESRRKMSESKLGMSQEAFTILVRWLLRAGWSKTKIARELRKSWPTIAKYAKPPSAKSA